MRGNNDLASSRSVRLERLVDNDEKAVNLRSIMALDQPAIVTLAHARHRRLPPKKVNLFGDDSTQVGPITCHPSTCMIPAACLTIGLAQSTVIPFDVGRHHLLPNFTCAVTRL